MRCGMVMVHFTSRTLKDAPALALQMGNSPDVIFRHYRQLVRPKDAERYWQIKPADRTGAKVVSFSARA